jgi:hypothetical protein
MLLPASAAWPLELLLLLLLLGMGVCLLLLLLLLGLQLLLPWGCLVEDLHHEAPAGRGDNSSSRSSSSSRVQSQQTPAACSTTDAPSLHTSKR